MMEIVFLTGRRTKNVRSSELNIASTRERDMPFFSFAVTAGFLVCSGPLSVVDVDSPLHLRIGLDAPRLTDLMRSAFCVLFFSAPSVMGDLSQCHPTATLGRRMSPVFFVVSAWLLMQRQLPTRHLLL